MYVLFTAVFLALKCGAHGVFLEQILAESLFYKTKRKQNKKAQQTNNTKTLTMPQVNILYLLGGCAVLES